jgi:ribonuclease BN (tRNA processing enzyme)
MNTNRGKMREESEALPIVKREFWDKVFEEVLKEDTVICEECGESMKQIQYRHLKYKHNMTLEEYTKKYPNSKLVSESAKNYGQKNPMNLPGVREKHITKMNTPELKEVFSKNAKNRVVKEETRLKCSKIIQ